MTLDLSGVLQPLGSSSEAGQPEAILQLCGNKWSPTLITAIAGHLVPSKADDLRRGAAVALGILSDAGAVGPLCIALDVQKESTFLLSDLAEALRNIADRAAAEPLLRWLASFDAQAQRVGNRSRFEHIGVSDVDMKRFVNGMAHAEVIQALGVLRIPEATPYLIRALQDREFVVSNAAVQALSELFPTARTALEAIICDRNLIAERRREALMALGTSDEPDAIPALTLAIRDPDNGISMDAVEALSQMTDQRAFETIVDVLEGHDARLSRCAASALGTYGETRAIQPLRRALRSSDQETRVNAARALANLSDASGTGILVTTLTDSKNAKYAAESLSKLRDPRAYESLTSMLTSKDQWERSTAAHGLGRLGDRRAIPALVRLLADSERHVRLSAAAGLAMVGDLRGFDVLVRGLWLSGICDHEQRVAIEALGRSGDARALPHLVRALRGAPRKARRSMAEAMGHLGTLASDSLLAELADARPIVRQHAAEALGRIGDCRTLRSLADLERDDPDQHVRAAATAAVKRFGAAVTVA